MSVMIDILTEDKKERLLEVYSYNENSLVRNAHIVTLFVSDATACLHLDFEDEASAINFHDVLASLITSTVKSPEFTCVGRKVFISAKGLRGWVAIANSNKPQPQAYKP